MRLTPAPGLFSAQGILTAWLANDELFVKGTIGQISVFPSWALKKTERFVCAPGCFCEAGHISGCEILRSAGRRSAARRRAQSALCWAPSATARSREILRESLEKKLQRQVKTTPAAALVLKIPYYEPANLSHNSKPSHFYSLQVWTPLQRIMNTKFTDYQIQRQYNKTTVHKLPFPNFCWFGSDLDLSVPGASSL